MANTDPDATTVVTFKNVPIFSDSESTKEGRPVYHDQEICEVKFAGNKQTVGAFPAHEQCGWVDDPATGVRTQQTYAIKYNEQYLAFKNGEGQAQNGTPLAAAPFLTASKRLELQALNIWTVESLAALDGAPLKRLGMQGRELQQQAQAFLDKAPGAAQERLTSVISDQDQRIADLEKQIAALSARKPDPLDHDGNGKKGGAKKEAAEVSAFIDFDDQDIKNWLAEADPSLAIDGRWSRETLLAKADEVNAALSAKAKAS